MAGSKSTDPMIAALLRERAGYIQSNKTDRADQVTAELKRRGYTDDDEADNAPKGRHAPTMRTAAAEVVELPDEPEPELKAEFATAPEPEKRGPGRPRKQDNNEG